MYTYRVLNKYDYENIENKNKIIAKSAFTSDETILDALKVVGQHLQNGSKKDFPWISTSTSFTTVMEHYAVPYSNDETNIHKQRDLVAIFFDMYQSGIYSNINVKLDTPVSLIDNIIINVSTDEERVKACDLGLLYKKNGVRYSPLQNISPGLKYARKSKEILILNYIDTNKIKYILNPLEMDLLYAIIKNLEINKLKIDIDKFIDNILSTLNNINVNNVFTETEAMFYKEFFIKDKFLCDIVHEIMKQNNISTCNISKDELLKKDKKNNLAYIQNDLKIDILSIYAYIKNIKRIIIGKLLRQVGYNLDSVPIVEDYIHIIRIGKINKKENNSSVHMLYFNNKPIFVKDVSKYLYPKSRQLQHNTFVYGYVYDTSSIEHENLYTLGNPIESKCSNEFLINNLEDNFNDDIYGILKKNIKIRH